LGRLLLVCCLGLLDPSLLGLQGWERFNVGIDGVWGFVSRC